MARSPTTPRKTTSTQTDRVAKRLTKQQAALEKQMINDLNLKVVANGGRMPKLSDLKKLNPASNLQAEIFQAWDQELDSDLTSGWIMAGCAGTGKSTIALYLALKEVLSQESIYKKVCLIRSTAPLRDSGFVPGFLEDKNSVAEAPYYGICEFLTGGNKDAYAKLKETGKIEFLSTAYLRGTTFSDCIVIVEECQCMNWSELKTCNTRLGKNAKIIFTGDFAQSDLIYNKNDVSGWNEFMAVSNKMSEFRKFTFTPEDICRSGFVRSFIVACDSLGL